MKWTGFFFLLIISSSSLAFELPPAFQASYQLEKYGSIVASTQLSLNLKNNNIHYQSRSKAEGLAALFSSDKINEQSVLEYIDSQTPRLLEYHYARKKSRKTIRLFSLTGRIIRRRRSEATIKIKM